MQGMTVRAMADVCHGTFYGDRDILEKEIASIVTDSRKAEQGGAYAAIIGEKADGHDFIGQVFEKGAILCFGENECPVSLTKGQGYIRVNDTVLALGDFAREYMKILDIPVVGITGSVGKTSTKETVAAVLATKYKVGKTQGNFNNEIGLPVTCFTFDSTTEIAVLEMGISAPGEMDYLTNIVQPDVAVITNIGVSHMEILGSRDGIFNEKIKIIKNLPKNGTAVLCADDDKLSSLDDHGENKYIFYGSEMTDKTLKGIYAEDIVQNGLDSTDFTIRTGSEGIEMSGLDGLRITVPVPGRHMVLNSLAAAIVGIRFGISPHRIKEGIGSMGMVAGRSNILRTNHITIIDDCYNASPVSVKSSIDTMSKVKGRKVLVLGDMYELGRDERSMHYDVGAYAKQKGADMILTVGNLANEYIKGATDTCPQDKIECIAFSTNDDLINQMPELIEKGDTILVKASNSMNFSQIVKALEDLKV